jgi:carotenoid cleavage dioxygenase-like enzyme
MKNILFLFFLSVAAHVQADEIRPLGLMSLTQEVPNIKLLVRGEVPQWLEGTLVRNGPALFNVGDTYVKHWFDGAAMLHAFRFSKGTVTYQNKFFKNLCV